METKTLPILSLDQVLQKLREKPIASRAGYMAMYSTWFGGITTDPQVMMVPIDDHIVHRGDGVFEAAKCVNGKIYALRPHLERLKTSAAKISLTLPHSIGEIEKIAVETTRAACANSDSGSLNAILRLYISRGPGGFTANPYESVGSQMYLVITPYKPVPSEKHESGVKVKISEVGIKEGFFSQVKSCNYLPNVLMKKESVDWGVDFTVTRDEDGIIAESSTENFAIVSKTGELIVPSFDRTLRGITALRAMELAKSLVKSGDSSGSLTEIRNGNLRLEDVREAREAMMLGTTLDCLPVTSFEGAAVGDGRVGPICREILRLLKNDMSEGPSLHKV